MISVRFFTLLSLSDFSVKVILCLQLLRIALNDHNGALGPFDNLFGHASNQMIQEPCHSVRGDDDQIHTVGMLFFQYFFGGRAFSDLRDNLDLF